MGTNKTIRYGDTNTDTNNHDAQTLTLAKLSYSECTR